MISIAVLLTCFNRRERTLKALATLWEVVKVFNKKFDYNVSFDVFLTDDGCSDNTAEFVLRRFGNKNITIIPADGNAYWAGGMRLAWNAAINTRNEYDFFLLINDDTVFKENCLEELIRTHEYALVNYGKGGVYVGFVSSSTDEKDITYGAKIYNKGLFKAATLLRPNGTPQECSMTNGNILMVSKQVVDIVGILDSKFIHAAADMDYGIRASRAGFPVLATSAVCGYCDNDHDNSEVEEKKVKKMNLKQRKEFLNRPNIKQYHDSLEFFKRYDKLKYIICCLSYYLNLYWPSFYYVLYGRRGH